MRLTGVYGVPAALLLSHSRGERETHRWPRTVLLSPGHESAPAEPACHAAPISLCTTYEELRRYDASPIDSDCSSRSEGWDYPLADADLSGTDEQMPIASGENLPPCWAKMNAFRGEPPLP